MKRAVLIVLAFVAGTGSAAASTGNSALALAALVGKHAPRLAERDRRALASMLEGRLGFAYPRRRTITVKASAVSCRASDVDIAEHDCTLRFGRTARAFKGRAAHELYATLVENGVSGDGAAGSIYEAVRRLTCTVEPGEVKQRDGGGAACTWSSP